MRKIIMLKDNERLGYKKGEVYEAETYWLDPDKLTAMKNGKCAGFNIYRESKGEEWDIYKE